MFKIKCWPILFLKRTPSLAGRQPPSTLLLHGGEKQRAMVSAPFLIRALALSD